MNINNHSLFLKVEELIKNKPLAFGGSFNPPTIAHQKLIEVLIKYEPSQIILIPNGDDYEFDNIDKNLVVVEDRIKMCELLFVGLNFTNFVVSDIETKHLFKGTVNSLRTLNHPTFVFGEDCLMSLSRWKEYEKLVEENTFIVFTRGSKIEDLKKYILHDAFLKNFSHHFAFLDFDMPFVSSTLFRETHDKTLVTTPIYQYILNKNLYEVNNEQ